MSDERMDPALLAAFLDGQLTGAERDAVLRQLAADPEARAHFLEAAAIAGELTALADDDDVAAPPAVSVPARIAPAVTPPARSQQRLVPALLLLAASIAIVVLLRPTRDGASVDAVQLAAAVQVPATPGPDPMERTLGPEWRAPGWSVARGSGASQSPAGATDDAERRRVVAHRATRLGVRAAELQLAVRLRDSAATAIALQAVTELLAEVDGASPVSTQVARLVPGAEAGADADRRALVAQLQAVSGDPARFDLGVWLESARLATLAGDTAWFTQSGAPHRALSRLLERRAPDAEWTALVAPLYQLLADTGARRDAAQVRAVLVGVIQAAAP